MKNGSCQRRYLYCWSFMLFHLKRKVSNRRPRQDRTDIQDKARPSPRMS